MLCYCVGLVGLRFCIAGVEEMVGRDGGLIGAVGGYEGVRGKLCYDKLLGILLVGDWELLRSAIGLLGRLFLVSI